MMLQLALVQSHPARLVQDQSPGKLLEMPEQIVEPLFGVVKVDRVGTYTRLSRVGVGDGKLQVPGKTATE